MFTFENQEPQSPHDKEYKKNQQYLVNNSNKNIFRLVAFVVLIALVPLTLLGAGIYYQRKLNALTQSHLEQIAVYNGKEVIKTKSIIGPREQHIKSGLVGEWINIREDEKIVFNKNYALVKQKASSTYRGSWELKNSEEENHLNHKVDTVNTLATENIDNGKDDIYIYQMVLVGPEIKEGSIFKVERLTEGVLILKNSNDNALLAYRKSRD